MHAEIPVKWCISMQIPDFPTKLEIYICRNTLVYKYIIQNTYSIEYYYMKCHEWMSFMKKADVIKNTCIPNQLYKKVDLHMWTNYVKAKLHTFLCRIIYDSKNLNLNIITILITNQNNYYNDHHKMLKCGFIIIFMWWKTKCAICAKDSVHVCTMHT